MILINISSKKTIELSAKKTGEIVGLKLSNVAYPRIDFKKARNAGSTARGFTITGNNQFMKYLIVENAGDNGIWIKGANNLLDHIIARYNNDSSIQLSDDANSNTLNYCYSYRNIVVKTYGGNADGFAPKLGASNIVFNYCFAWDNSDDGWDSYDKRRDYSATVSYLHSACWNNGNPDIFTGKYDYDNKKSLDKGLWTIQQLMDSDSSFETNCNNRAYSIEKGKIDGQNAFDWLSKAHEEMNGNWFKFGSSTTAKSSKVTRKAVYSVAFDHKSKGFDNNNSEKCTGYISNCVSFNNNINHQLPYTFEKWENNWSWNPKKADKMKMKETLEFNIPKDKIAAVKDIYSIRDKIIKNCAKNIFDDTVNFDEVIKNLV